MADASGTTITSSPADPPKPGIKTTEFWVALATQISGAFAAQGVFASGSTGERIAGLASMAVTAVVYILSRTKVKTS